METLKTVWPSKRVHVRVCAPPEALDFFFSRSRVLLVPSAGKKWLKRFPYKRLLHFKKWMPAVVPLPLGFCPRVQVSELFSAVRMGGNQFKHKSWGVSRTPSCRRWTSEGEHGTRAGPGATHARAGGESGGSAPAPRGRSAPRRLPALAPGARL